ncbi:Peptidoglycan/LPS O-acetylase OafA/YrhL, contains acyltransferase and SGNH-hydrolase domains [Sporobacter termitidis DSM 10068]|uniref:Peptidoglycan/LPS O-acetylase OafA/YrhL, contains acyltransferase and SGNH-hydrolase domains n=1 Tax=Sporobacter termitidis DSM 10068 TaxID=1123282 RepID=A0A1M5ZFC3_9FIRM|nr:acyltransferase family protein [Sporobacter termitidis]SHI22623.1 Peptidoglycan/LPS O-acetylase OafA/YrhL, contains acyltransferase and SGNH-hydrolase domains [Sporobacter termitidis DSM 10068]
MRYNTIQKRSYMPGLDGLRALAVVAVIGYHLGLPFLPGGFLGVTLFFALSGYLITDILMSEWARESKISLKNFFIRRGKRLLPAVIFLLLCVSAYVSLFRPDLLSNLKSAFLPALFFFSNWWYIFNGTPYFASFATPSLLTHFWSLAVEAQFYLIWPLLLIAGQRFIKKKWLMIALTALAAAASAVLMAVLFQPGVDPSRIYYGTDTRVFSLLLGACLALACPSRKIMEAGRSRTARIVLDVAGFAALLGILFAVIYFTQYDDILYRGGMFLFSVVSLLLIAAAATPSTIIGKFFSIKPLRFIGNISYGIYLWQFPVIVISNTVFGSDRVNVPLSICQVAATVLLAAFSYYAVERPIRKNRIDDLLRNDIYMKILHARWWKKTAGALAVALVVVAGVGLLYARPVDNRDEELSALPSELHMDPSNDPDTAPPPADTSTAPPSAEVSPSAPATPDDSPDMSPTPPGVKPSDKPSPPPSPEGTDPAQSPSPPPAASPTDSAPIVSSDLSVTLIGDSIGIDVAPYLKKYYPNMIAEAKVGRQFYEAKKVITELIQNDQLAPTVIIELGSNGTVKESSLRDIIDLIGSDRKIVFVNTQVPKSWCTAVNSTLSKVSEEYANTVVADWYGASVNKSEYFYKDDVHPNKAGSLVLAKVISDAIENLHNM